MLPALLPSGATPYSAPEVLEGRQPDSRSDIFSFGAVVYEMLTGRRAFEGDSPAALAAAIVNSKPPSSGSPAADRLLAGCLAKDPAARLQRMQKVLLELKLLTVAARRAEAPAPRVDQVEAVLSSHMRKLETGVAERLEEHQKRMSAIERSAIDAVTNLRGEIANLGAQVGSALGHAATTEATSARFDTHETRISEVERSAIDAVTNLRGEIANLGAQVGSALEHTATTEATSARFDTHETRISEVERSAIDAVTNLRGEIANLGAQVGSALEHAATTEATSARFDTHETRISEVERSAIDAVTNLRGEIASLGAQVGSALEHAATTEATSARFDTHETRISEVERSAIDAVTNLRGEIANLGAQVGFALEKAGPTEAIDAAGERIVARVDQRLESVSQRIGGIEQSVGGVIDRLLHLEGSLDTLRQDSATLQKNVASDLQDFEQKLKSQASAIESVRTAMSQTDDLVERVVEALGVLQSSVIERNEERAAMAN